MIICTLKSKNGSTHDEMLQRTALSEKAGQMMLTFEEAIPWYTGMTYDGHTLKRKTEGWLLVVRVHDNGNPLVCFIGGEDPTDCARSFAIAAIYGGVVWHEDKYA